MSSNPISRTKIRIYDKREAVQVDRKNIIEMKQCRNLEAIYRLPAAFSTSPRPKTSAQQSWGDDLCYYLFSWLLFLYNSAPSSARRYRFFSSRIRHNMKLRFAIFHPYSTNAVLVYDFWIWEMITISFPARFRVVYVYIKQVGSDLPIIKKPKISTRNNKQEEIRSLVRTRDENNKANTNLRFPTFSLIRLKYYNYEEE